MVETDALVIGAGPVGLFQAFQLGLLGMDVHVVDVLPEAGGQCIALYPDKPIYDVPGVPRCTGRELTALLLQQAAPFLAAGRNLHLGSQVQALSGDQDLGYDVGIDGGLHFRAKALFVAAGAGAFVPRSLNIAQLAGAPNVHHHLPAAGREPWVGQSVVVAGGGDDALTTVLDLAASPLRASRITLLHRRDQFQADPALEQGVRELIARGSVYLCLGMPQDAAVGDDGRVAHLRVMGPDGQAFSLPLDHLLVRQGLSPKLGPLADWGLSLERKQIPVSADSFESARPGIFAVGDINTYPGKKRLLLCGFHEATMAAHAAWARLRPDDPHHLQYTTTSALLHQRLKV